MSESGVPHKEMMPELSVTGCLSQKGKKGEGISCKGNNSTRKDMSKHGTFREAVHGAPKTEREREVGNKKAQSLDSIRDREIS